MIAAHRSGGLSAEQTKRQSPRYDNEDDAIDEQHDRTTAGILFGERFGWRAVRGAQSQRTCHPTTRPAALFPPYRCRQDAQKNAIKTRRSAVSWIEAFRIAAGPAEDKAGAAARFTVDTDASAVFADNLQTDRQTDSGAA